MKMPQNATKNFFLCCISREYYNLDDVDVNGVAVIGEDGLIVKVVDCGKKYQYKPDEISDKKSSEFSSTGEEGTLQSDDPHA